MSAGEELRSFDDVAVVCEGLGLERLVGVDVHPYGWVTADRALAVAVACLGDQLLGIAVQRIVDWELGQSELLAEVKPYQRGSADMLRVAILASAPPVPWESRDDWDIYQAVDEDGCEMSVQLWPQVDHLLVKTADPTAGFASAMLTRAAAEQLRDALVEALAAPAREVWS